MILPRFASCLGMMGLLMVHAFPMPQVQPASHQAARLNLMPVPAELVPAEGKFRIDETLRTALAGYSEPRLKRAQIRFLVRLQERTGIRLLMDQHADAEHAQLVMHCAGPGEAVQSAHADESYSLVVNAEKIRLTAPSPLGILRGLETLLQLVDIDSESFYFPAVSIQDRPRFAWRGLMIDAARHWQPVEVIMRNLDAMAAVKMNVFHWHLSDDQGFRVESKRFPRLQALGSDGLYYTQSDVRAVVAYARDRGIRVVPEFDMPGHTTAWFPGYPRLASAPGPYQIERKWGVFDPVMDPSREEVYTFLDQFLAEMVPLFPDLYWHVGGDEVNGRQWNNSAALAAFKKRRGMKNNGDLQAYFNRRLITLLAKHGKQPVGWDEILHPDLSKRAIIQSWRQGSLAQAAQRGFSGILSLGYYLDHLRPASYHYLVDPMGQQAASLTEEQKGLILGGEACMWGEYMTSDNIDSRIWPRAAAIAERLWSPPDLKDIDDMYRRLDRISREIESLGLTNRSSYGNMLQRMTPDRLPDALKVLGDIVESVKQLGRGRFRSYTSFTPMNRLTDAVPPESDLARDFNRRVDLATGSQPELAAQADDLRLLLTKLRDNDSLLQPLLQESFLLRELQPLSANVAVLAAAGLEALAYLESGRKPPESWTSDRAALLQRVDKPEAEVLIMIMPGVRKLIAAANKIP